MQRPEKKFALKMGLKKAAFRLKSSREPMPRESPGLRPLGIGPQNPSIINTPGRESLQTGDFFD
jgi:hypothetical protein